VNCAETTITLCADSISALNAFYVKYQLVALFFLLIQRPKWSPPSVSTIIATG
jgi:hypothetical protein